jgi:hypothetical protein
LGIAEIDSTARALRDQAVQLGDLVAKFTFEESSQGRVHGNDTFAQRPALALHR